MNDKSILARAGRTITGGVAALGLALLALAAVPGYAQNGALLVPPPVAVPANGAAADGGEAPVVSATAYRLAPTDQLDITVEGHDEFHRSVQVLTDGTFRYPVVGSVAAVGKTPAQIEKVIAYGLRTVCDQPVVTVAVTAAHVGRVSVLGAVRSPGQFEYQPGMRVLDVLAATGGLVAAPELTQATLVTKSGQSSETLDLVALMSGQDSVLNVPVHPGDLLLFQPRDPAASMIQVIGQVVRPGQYPVVSGGATVLAMLTQAGGATDRAALTQVQILHGGQTRTVDLRPLASHLDDDAGKLMLVAGDTVLVPENKNRIAVLGEVRNPAVYGMPDGEPLPILMALAQAGGPTGDGDKRQVAILRLGADNQRHLIAINMDDTLKGVMADPKPHGPKAQSPKSQQIAMEPSPTDTLLQNGDILVVPSRNRKKSLGEYIGAVPGLFYISRLLSGL